MREGYKRVTHVSRKKAKRKVPPKELQNYLLCLAMKNTRDASLKHFSNRIAKSRKGLIIGIYKTLQLCLFPPMIGNTISRFQDYCDSACW